MLQTVEETPRLTSTSYLVLGLVQRGGPMTPYDLKRQVAATLGHFWSFPHALLYKEPARLVELGLLTRRARAGGTAAADVHHHRRRSCRTRRMAGETLPAPDGLRDAGLRQPFGMDMGNARATASAGRRRNAIHIETLATYKADWRAEGTNPTRRTEIPARTVERWRGKRCWMGLLVRAGGCRTGRRRRRTRGRGDRSHIVR